MDHHHEVQEQHHLQLKEEQKHCHDVECAEEQQRDQPEAESAQRREDAQGVEDELQEQQEVQVQPEAQLAQAPEVEVRQQAHWLEQEQLEEV